MKNLLQYFAQFINVVLALNGREMKKVSLSPFTAIIFLILKLFLKNCFLGTVAPTTRP